MHDDEKGACMRSVAGLHSGSFVPNISLVMSLSSVSAVIVNSTGNKVVAVIIQKIQVFDSYSTHLIE